MNEQQYGIVFLALLVMVVACFFPPMVQTASGSSDGYAFLFTPPASSRIDLARLSVQLMAVAGLSGLALILNRKARTETASQQTATPPDPTTKTATAPAGWTPEHVVGMLGVAVVIFFFLLAVIR